MKLEQHFELDENDLKQIVLDFLAKKGLKPKDEITVCINTNKDTVVDEGNVKIGRSWGFANCGVIISCEVENN
ncbi:MAG TPA: hypothetical protein VN026_00165 [Bacteroidia bacterium]|nr:hypothetical protein [Bacteroidia bacterium]